jgi:MFS family permease
VTLGIVFSSWAARIPDIRDGVGLSPAELGMVLLCGGIGAVLSFPVAAWLVGRHGARAAAACSGLLLLAMLAGLALAPRIAWLMTAMVGFGIAQTSFNVSINAVGTQLERSAGRSMLSRLHAWYCVGSFGGAVLGSLAAGAGLSPAIHFAGLVSGLAALLCLTCRALPPDSPGTTGGQSGFALPKGPLLALGIICFCAAIAEGAITDWSGIYMRDLLGASDGVSPLAFAAFSALMLAVRLVADRLKDRFDARRVVACGALVAVAGVVLAVAAWNVGTTITGFALTGAGFAAVFPFVFSAAGRRGSGALAAVATMGYSGVLIGPPVIGFVAHSLGLQAALALVGLAGLVMAAAAHRAHWLD